MSITLETLQANWDTAMTQYTKAFRRAVILDASDRNEFWRAINAKFPAYQILPYTNHVRYIKANLVASIYTIGKSARILPTSEEDKDIVEALNQFMDHFWAIGNVAYYQMQAGERAALLNLGITQVGWDNELTGGNGDTFYKGAPTFKNINPLKFMRDPAAVDLDHAAYCITWDTYHKSVFESNPNYKDAFAKYLSQKKVGATQTLPEQYTDQGFKNSFIQSQANYYTLIIHWVREGDAIHEIHTIDNKFELYRKENIKPNIFPFALCYCNLPNEDLIGLSEPGSIFANSAAYNIMNSIALTAEYKNQRPPRFISNTSGLNVQTFAKHGNDADRVFPVNGDASRAVHYQQFPLVNQQTFGILNTLGVDIQTTTGVDGHYTGRNTGSILTTGGIESMLAQATLIDMPKIAMYEEYAKRLTRLILYNLIEYSVARTYLVKKPTDTGYTKVTIPFPDIPTDAVFNYQINISSELPKNKQRMADIATQLMEKQMQYSSAGMDVDLITPEEWLMFTDFPFREYMMERMNIQRHTNLLEDVTEAIMTAGNLMQNGVDPQEAITLTAQQIGAKRKPGNYVAPTQQPITPDMDTLMSESQQI